MPKRCGRRRSTSNPRGCQVKASRKRETIAQHLAEAICAGSPGVLGCPRFQTYGSLLSRRARISCRRARLTCCFACARRAPDSSRVSVASRRARCADEGATCPAARISPVASARIASYSARSSSSQAAHSGAPHSHTKTHFSLEAVGMSVANSAIPEFTDRISSVFSLVGTTRPSHTALSPVGGERYSWRRPRSIPPWFLRRSLGSLESGPRRFGAGTDRPAFSPCPSRGRKLFLSFHSQARDSEEQVSKVARLR